MRKNMNYIRVFFMAAAGVLASVLMADYGYLVLTALLIALHSCTVLMVRKKYEKDVIQISDMLELIIQGESQLITTENADCLVSKLQSQTVKLHGIVTKYNEKLLGEQEEVRRFLSEIAHQIRTPLTNMETYLSLLQEEGVSREEQDNYISAVCQAEQKIKFLTESFISASRMEHRIIQIRKERLGIRETISKAIFQVYKKAEERHMNIRLICDEKLMISHDRNWLSEAVGNLLDNSIKYSPEGSEITVQAEKNEMFTRIQVRDYGMGIVDDENRIFRRFYRGSNVKDQEGFGMGLYITREIVKRHEGFLKVKREPDGTSFSIYLPC